MAKSNSFEDALLKLIFQNVDAANIGDAAGLQNSAAAGNFYVSLHTADPGETGTASTNEANYTGYSRVAVVRSASGWTVSGTNPTQVSNAALITFGACTAGSNTITHWALSGPTGSGAEAIVYKGTLGSAIAGPFTASAADLFTCPGHGLTTNDRVAFYPAFGSSLPTGVTEGTLYWVIATGLTADAFSVSTTQGGAALDVTAVGDGVAVKASTLAVSSGITPEFAIGALVIFED